MDADYREAADRLIAIARDSVSDANAIEFDMESLDDEALDNSRTKLLLERLCDQLDKIHRILVDDPESDTRGLIGRFSRWSGLVRTDFRNLDESERQRIADEILSIERDSLSKLGIRFKWVEKLVAEMRDQLAAHKTLSMTDELLTTVSRDIEALRRHVCNAEHKPRRSRLTLILEGVHGTVKIVADIGKFAVDPALVLALSGVYSVYAGGKMLSDAVKELNAEEEREKASQAPQTSRLPLPPVPSQFKLGRRAIDLGDDETNDSSDDGKG